MTEPNRLVNFSVQLYKLLIHLYPTSFRKKYGSEMTLVFREIITDSFKNNGMISMITTLICVIGDLFQSVFHEHLFKFQENIEMKPTTNWTGKSLAISSVAFFWIMPFSPFLSIAAVSKTKDTTGWPRFLALTGATLCIAYILMAAIWIFIMNINLLLSFSS